MTNDPRIRASKPMKLTISQIRTLRAIYMQAFETAPTYLYLDVVAARELMAHLRREWDANHHMTYAQHASKFNLEGGEMGVMAGITIVGAEAKGIALTHEKLH